MMLCFRSSPRNTTSLDIGLKLIEEYTQLVKYIVCQFLFTVRVHVCGVRVGIELREGESYVEAAKRELKEETEFYAPIDPFIADREDTYAVARSGLARWQERYFLVRYPAVGQEIDRHGWTAEER